MTSSEVSKELGMSYSELCKYLIDKYGPSEFDYYIDDSFKKNPKISRSGEGLQCHHIDEDKAIMLSTPKSAKEYPFDYQRADRLVYCNILEHLILHVKISAEITKGFVDPFVRPGRGGALNYIIPQMNDYFNGYKPKSNYQKKMFSLVKDNFDDYIKVLKYFYQIPRNYPSDVWTITKENLSRGRKAGGIVDRVYNRLRPLPYISDDIRDY